MDINLDIIIEFLKNLELENINQKIKINQLENNSQNLTNDLNNLSKVSMISNLDKQLKEKINTINLLEQQVNKLNSELQKKLPNKNNKLDNELKEKNNKISILENELEKINSAYEKNLSVLKLDNDLLHKEINELKTFIAKIKEDKTNDESSDDEQQSDDTKYPITFKKVNYLVDESDNVYDIINDKANKIVGKLVNNKVKFI
jgi:DNA repair exonuclease SbcCD ATPase subunit